MTRNDADKLVRIEKLREKLDAVQEEIIAADWGGDCTGIYVRGKLAALRDEAAWLKREIMRVQVGIE